jgi:DNA-binding response OmpR family regulator
VGAEKARQRVAPAGALVPRKGYRKTSLKRSLSAVRASVVVLDTNGLDLLQQFRAGSHQPAIIVLTAGGSEEARVSALDQGAEDYMTKPFSPRELLALIRACLRWSSPNSAWRDSPALFGTRG